MTVDFGSDINTPGGLALDPYFAEIDGADALAQALLRRVVTPRGGLLGDPHYGFDLRVFANDSDPPLRAIEAGVVEQLTLDERVDRAACAATFDATTETLTVVATAFTADGTFILTLAVSAVTVDLLDLETA